ncbi:UNVERIFIED_CONTAM: hypothetical protein FKN15_071602 [Acipenser sinensis]
MPSWQSYKCLSLDYEMLVIESMDSDTETRRLSPVAVLGDGYIDLINGPQDHGWCAGYTCQKRVSLFHSIVATNKSYDIYFTSTSPQNLRLMLLIADSSKVVRVAVFYSSPQRLDVYVENKLVAPTNADWNSDNTDYTLKEPTSPDQYIPQMKSEVYGSNYFDNTYKMLNILVRGSTPVEIRTSPLLFISFQMPAMTIDKFFGDSLIMNLAIFLKIPANKIRITKIVRENRRRKRATGLTVKVQIAEPPAQRFSNSTSPDQLDFKNLQEISNTIGQMALTGKLSDAIGFNVSSVAISKPVPSTSDPQWSQMAAQPTQRTDQAGEYVSTVTRLIVVTEPVAGKKGQNFTQQPSIMAVDANDNCVCVGITTLTLTAKLTNLENQDISGLNGTTTVPFSGCWANYTDLSLSISGTDLMLAFTLNNVKAQSKSFSVKANTATTATPTANAGAFGSSNAFKAEALYVISIIYSLMLILCI